MQLILWRHAEAEEGEPDLARKLTGRGEKQARRVAQWLHAQLPNTARLLVSPAVRAQQTARALSEISHRKIRTVDQIAPDATVQDVLEAAQWPDARSAIVIVGHQPTLGQVASFLMSGQARNWSIKKAGVWWFSSREGDDGEVAPLLRAVVSPEMF
jgi:phosphohistidine phosphatase